MIRPWARSTLLAACSGRAAAAPWLGEGERTGIDKRPLDGPVHVGDDVEVVHQPDHDVTSADVLRIHTRDRHQAASLLEVDGLAARVREWARSQAWADG